MNVGISSVGVREGAGVIVGVGVSSGWANPPVKFNARYVAPPPTTTMMMMIRKIIGTLIVTVGIWVA